MKEFDLGNEDEGVQKFKYNGKEIIVDILDTLQKLEELGAKKASGLNIDYLGDVVKLLEAFGLENVTKLCAVKFIKWIKNLADELKKNIEQTVS